VYATELQPDYDAGWADGATIRAAARVPSLSFDTRTVSSPQLLVAAPPDEARQGGPQFASSARATQPVGPPAPKDDATKGQTLPPGVRVPLWTPADSAPAPTGVDARMPWRTLITLLVLALLAGGAYLGYPRAHTWWIARSVPADLHAYVGGEGVLYGPAGQGYSVRLPKAPVHRNVAPAPTGPPALWRTMHRSAVAGPDYQIVIRVAHLSSGATLPFGAPGALVDPRLAGTPRPTNVRGVEFQGRPAFDYDVGADPLMRGRVFRYGARLYVVTVQATKGANRVLDELMRSFKIAA
jgi:hypothetical protein